MEVRLTNIVTNPSCRSYIDFMDEGKSEFNWRNRNVSCQSRVKMSCSKSRRLNPGEDVGESPSSCPALLRALDVTKSPGTRKGPRHPRVVIFGHSVSPTSRTKAGPRHCYCATQTFGKEKSSSPSSVKLGVQKIGNCTKYLSESVTSLP